MTISEVVKNNPLMTQAKQYGAKAKQLRQQAQQQRAAERLRKTNLQAQKAVQAQAAVYKRASQKTG